MSPHLPSESKKISKASGLAKHGDSSSSSRQLGTSTTSNFNQLAPSRKRNDAGTSPGVHEHHQTAGPFIHDNTAQPYLPIARPWGSGDPTQPGVGNSSNDQDVTPMDRWLSLNARNEMWNNVHAVYGTHEQQADVGAGDDGTITNWSGEAVHSSEAGGFA